MNAALRRCNRGSRCGLTASILTRDGWVHCGEFQSRKVFQTKRRIKRCLPPKPEGEALVMRSGITTTAGGFEPIAKRNGFSTCYEDAGSGDPIVFMRGLNVDLQVWPFQVPSVEQDLPRDHL